MGTARMRNEDKPNLWLYVYEGCEKHGCKIGVTTDPEGRIKGIRSRCQKSHQFAHLEKFPEAFEIEQAFVLLFNERRASRRHEEWFHMPLEEMMVGIEWIRENRGPVHLRPPRRHRYICGHVYRVNEDGNRLDGGPIHKAA